MLRHFKNLAGHTVVYGLGRMAIQAAGVVLIPLYTHYLKPDQMGELSLYYIFLSLINVALNLGMSSALFKYYFESDDPNYRRKIISTSYYFNVAYSIVLCSILLWMSPQFSVWLFDTDSCRVKFALVFIISFFDNLSLIPLAIWRAMEKSFLYSVIGFCRFLLNVGSIVFFVVVRKEGTVGILKGMLISSSIMGIYFIFYMFRHLKLIFSYTELKRLLSFGMPIMPSQLAVWIMTMSDRMFIKKYLTLNDVGVYHLGNKIGSLINILIVAPFSTAWAAFMFSVAKEKRAKDFYSLLATYFWAFVGFIALGLSVFAKEIVHLIATKDYYEAYKMVPWVSYAFVMYGLYFILSAGLNITKKTVYFPLITLISAILFVGLNYALIPIFSIEGAAIAAFASYVTMAGLTYVFSQKYYPVHFEYLRFFKVLIVMLVLLAIGSRIEAQGWHGYVIKALLCAGYPFLLFALRFFKQNELDLFKKIYLKATRTRIV
jgi:O-antigen/teichoic acid export membrane protein